MMVNARYRVPTTVLLAIGGFVVSWLVIHHGWFTRGQLLDTTVYAHYAHLMKAGRLPYRDFAEVYPPLALPVFLIPGLIAGKYWGGYNQVFQLGMLACGLFAVGLAAFVLARQKISAKRLAAAVALGALTPLLMGSVILSRYDLWPAALTIAAVVAIYYGRHRTGFVLLGLGFAAKAFPIVILPIAMIYVWRTESRRKALICLAAFVAVVVVCFLPFVILSPHGVWASIQGQTGRPLQIESLGAAIWLAAHQLLGTHLSLYFTHGSDNLNGHPAMQFATAMGVIQALAVLGVWVVFAAGRATRERLLVAAAAAVCAFVVFDVVLSPQYLIWLAPLVMLVPGRRGLVAIGLLALSMGLTQIWFPLHFDQLKLFHPLQSWAVIGRDLVLVALFGTLAWPDVPLRGPARAWLSRLRHARPVSRLPRPEEA
jgi:hypothetical protein